MPRAIWKLANPVLTTSDLFLTFAKRVRVKNKPERPDQRNGRHFREQNRGAVQRYMRPSGGIASHEDCTVAIDGIRSRGLWYKRDAQGPFTCAAT